VKLRPGALEWREIEGQIVALDIDASEYLAVNRTGTAIWPLLVAGATSDELAARLAAAYDLDRESAGRYVDEFLASLAERNLLEAEDAPPAEA
jgi:Coenzyme PQQ synthesis protein D (PqqD)